MDKNLEKEMLDAKTRLDLITEELNLKELEKNGVIEKIGDFYYCNDTSKLPEHVKAKCKISSDSNSKKERLEVMQELSQNIFDTYVVEQEYKNLGGK